MASVSMASWCADTLSRKTSENSSNKSKTPSMVLRDADYFRQALTKILRASAYLPSIVAPGPVPVPPPTPEEEEALGRLVESILYSFARVLVVLCQTYKKGKNNRKRKNDDKHKLDEDIEAGYPLSVYRLC